MEDKKRNRVLAVLFFGVLMGALDIAIVGPALPAIRESFAGLSERSLAWMFSAYVLFNLIGIPLMSKLSDLYGRRTIYMLDVALFAAGSLVVALSPSFTFVLLGRAIQGFGAGGIFPVAAAVIGDTFPPEKRGRALGLIGMVFGLAFIIGPLLGGVILSLATWKWLFLVNLPVALVLLLVSARLLPFARPDRSGCFDWPGMLVLSAALACLAYGLSMLDTTRIFASLASRQVLPFLLGAVVFGLLTVAVERQAENPLLPGSLFTSRQLRLAYALTAGAGIGEASLVFMPLLALAALPGISKSQASYLLMPVVLGMTIGSPTAGRMLDRAGSRVVILSGTSIFAAGVFLLSRFPGNLGLYIFSGALMGLGLSALLGAPIRYITLNEVTADQRSTAQGVVAVFTSIGQLTGSAIFGAVAASLGGGVRGYGSGFLVVSVLAVVLLGVAFGLKARRLEQASHGEALAAEQQA